MNNTRMIIGIGVILMLLGTRTIVKPTFYDAVYGYIDLTGYNVPFGVFMIISGIWCIWIALKKKNKSLVR